MLWNVSLRKSAVIRTAMFMRASVDLFEQLVGCDENHCEKLRTETTNA
jgi:hypothetical protein